MKLIEHEDGTVSINTSIETMQKIMCAITHIAGQDFNDLYEDIDEAHPLHPENCFDILKQEIDDVDLTQDGKIIAFMTLKEK